MVKIDFNVDAGEGFENESLIFPWVSSCNISCASHAGTSEITKNTILLAKEHKLKIGAHPSYPDKLNFGRKSMSLTDGEFIDMLKQQLILFFSIMNEEGLRVHHVKAHGALYHDIHLSKEKAFLFLETIDMCSHKPAIYGLPNSILEKACEEKGYQFIREAFADRLYLDNGHLVSRKEKNSILSTQKEINDQVYFLAKHGFAKSINDQSVVLNPQTICFHGDHEGAEKRIKIAYIYVTDLGISVDNG